MSGSSIGGLVGALVGSFTPLGPQLGFAIGSTLGGIVDPVKVSGPRLSNATQQTSQEGIILPWGYGTFPTAGTVIFAGPLNEHPHREGGKGGPVTTTYTYTRSFGIAFCKAPFPDGVSGFQKVKINGKLVYDISPTSTITAENAKFLEYATLYLGSESQMVDPTIEAIKGVGATGPMRGVAWIMFTDYDCTELAGAIPQVEVVVQMCGAVTAAPDYLETLGPEFYYKFTEGGTSTPDSSGNAHNAMGHYGDYSTAGGGFTVTPVVQTGNAFQSGGGGLDGTTTWSVFMRLRLNAPLTEPCWIVGENTNSIFGFFHWVLGFTDGVEGHGYLNGAANNDSGSGGQVVSSPHPLSVGEDHMIGLRRNGAVLELLIDGAVVNSVPCSGSFAGTSAFMVGEHYLVGNSPAMTFSHLVGVRRAVSDIEAALTTYFVGVVPDGWREVPDAPNTILAPDDTQYFLGASENIASCGAYLNAIVEDLCSQAGVDVATEVDTSQLTDFVPGFKCATESGADGFIQSLTQAFAFDRAEWDKKLRFPKRGGAVVATLTMDDLVAQDGPAIQQSRVQEPELLRKINVLSLDPAADYNATKQTWERRAGTIKALGESTIELPIVLSADAAAQVAEILGKSAWAETDHFRYGLSVAHSALTPTDVVTLQDKKSIVHRQRLTETNELAGVFSVDEAVKDRASVYVGSAVGAVNPNLPGPTTPGLIGPTLLAVMNLPQLRTQDHPGLWLGIAGISSGWSGATVLMSLDAEVSWTTVLSVATPTKMGPLTTDVASGGEPISVHVYGGQLENKTSAQVALGANYSAISSAGVAEVFAYETASESPANYYGLTDTSPGLLGTNAAPHFADDDFMDLASAHLLELDENLAGQTIYFKAVGFGVSADAVGSISIVYDPTVATYIQRIDDNGDFRIDPNSDFRITNYG